MKNKTLNEIVQQHPGSRFTFEKFHLDYCCGGKQTLEHACSKKGLDPEELITDIHKRAHQKEDAIDFSHWPLDLLADYIEKKHHRYVQESLPHILEKLDRLVTRHGYENPQLVQVRELFETMAVHLSAHMKKEELVLFPFIRNAVRAKRSGETLTPFGFGTVVSPVNVMEKEHAEEGKRLEAIAELTANYTPPAYACATWQYTYEKLAEFEKDLHMHIYLENGILFPGAIALEAELASKPVARSFNPAGGRE